MALKIGTDLLNLQICHILHKNNRMGISHGNTGHMICLPLHLNRLINRLFLITYHRNSLRNELRSSHINPYSVHFPFTHVQCQVFDLTKAFHCKFSLVSQSLIVNIFAYTTDAVSTHFRAGSVCIPHLHLKIRNL